MHVRAAGVPVELGRASRRLPDLAAECIVGLDDLPPEWATLLGDHIFDSCRWYRTVCDAGLPLRAEALFVAIKARGHVVALFPMRRDGDTVSSLTTPYTCLWRPLLQSGLTAQELVDVGRAFGRWCREWSTVRLDALDLQDHVWPLLLQGVAQSGIVPLPFDHFGNWSVRTAGIDWSSYIAGRPGQLRETFRRREKQLMKAGATFRVVTGISELPGAITAYETVYAASWKEPEPFLAFNPVLMKSCAEDGSLRLGLLELDGVVLAAQFWVVEDGKASVLKLAHREDRRAQSPGTVLTGMMIRRLLDEEHVVSLDFGRGDDDYKQAWTDMRRQRQGLILACPWRPTGLAAVVRARLRSLARLALRRR
jgi:hypothetical protein